jgi:hypothetical protein
MGLNGLGISSGEVLAALGTVETEEGIEGNGIILFAVKGGRSE